MLLLAFPILAWGNPVVVITHSAGTTSVDGTILRALGLNSVAGTTRPFYELTLTSVFDTEDNPYQSGASAYADGAAVIDFRIGSQHFHYAGKAHSLAFLSAQSTGVDSYMHSIGFDTPGSPNSSFAIAFAHQLFYIPDSQQPGEALAPLDIGDSDGVPGSYTIYAFPGNPDVPLSWIMGGRGSMISVHIAPVPEPTPFALAAAGLLTLGLSRCIAQGKLRMALS
jgi:hypothetical protein